MKKLLALLLALMLTACAVPAFAELEPGTVIEADPSLYAGIDLSSPYTVQMYLIGDRPADCDKIFDAVNEYLKPYNTSINPTFLSWSDYTTMYSLVLAGGEQVDLIFTAPWCFLFTESAKGAFYELTDDFIARAMPLSAEHQAKVSWDETTINGKLVAVPSNQQSGQSKYVAIRDDLRIKYGLDELQNWDDLMTYLMTIAEQETPVSGIYAEAASTDNVEMWRMYFQQFNMYPVYNDDFLYVPNEVGALAEEGQIQLAYTMPEFRAFCHDMKKLADAGCWSRSALTNTVTAGDAFANLQSAMVCWNGTVFNYMKTAEKTEGVVCAAYDLTKENIILPEAYSNNCMAIAAASRNPERAAMVLDLIKFDTYLNNTLIRGIEGVHYINEGAGLYSEGPEFEKFIDFALSVSWAIKNGDMEKVGADPRQTAMSDQQKERVVPNPNVTFIFNEAPVKAYLAAVNSVVEEYKGMLELGLVDDVDATIDEMIGKLQSSGLQKVYDEYYKQYDAWKATR